jgi:predicted HTH domain antitoxin
MTTITLQVPDEDLDTVTPEELLKYVERTARVETVIKMWQVDEISEGYASDLLGLTRNEFYAILADRGISSIKATTEELNDSYQRFKVSLESEFGDKP